MRGQSVNALIHRSKPDLPHCSRSNGTCILEGGEEGIGKDLWLSSSMRDPSNDGETTGNEKTAIKKKTVICSFFTSFRPENRAPPSATATGMTESGRAVYFCGARTHRVLIHLMAIALTDMHCVDFVVDGIIDSVDEKETSDFVGSRMTKLQLQIALFMREGYLLSQP